jgi:hypothetical protein
VPPNTVQIRRKPSVLTLMSLLFLSIPCRSSIFQRATGFWGSLKSDTVCDTRNYRLDVPRGPR